MSGYSELDRLRLVLRAADERGRPTDACPPAETLWAAVTGQSDSASVRSVVLHVAACGACSEAWRLAKEISEDAGESRAVPSAGPAGRPRWVRPVLGVAAAVLALGAFLAIRDAGVVRPEAAYRDPAPEESIHATIPDGVSMPRTAFVLRWKPAPDGTRYDVEVAGDDLSPVAHANDLTQAEYTVPAAALAGLPAGRRLVWRVSATLPDGRRVKSAAFVATLADGPRP